MAIAARERSKCRMPHSCPVASSPGVYGCHHRLGRRGSLPHRHSAIADAFRGLASEVVSGKGRPAAGGLDDSEDPWGRSTVRDAGPGRSDRTGTTLYQRSSHPVLERNAPRIRRAFLPRVTDSDEVEH